jgi:uncharacterized protein YbaP (TraB family)
MVFPMVFLTKFFAGGKQMKRVFLLSGILIGLTGVFASCDNPTQTSSTPSSVWEISKNGNSLFLGGSVHLLRVKDYPMPAAFDYAFDTSAIFVMETDVDKMADAEIVQYQYDKLILPEGQTLQTVLDDAVYKRLETAVGGPGVMGEISQYKPSVAINALQAAYLQVNKFTENGADLYYLAKSKSEGKPIEFLEDVKIQIDMLGSMADGYENEYVSASIDELPQYVNGVIALVSEWKEGAAEAIESSLNAQKAAWPVMYEIMIYDRNNAWTQKIEQYLTTEQVEFVVVGLAHLHGQDGLLNQLKNQGYTIRQLVN